MDTKVLYAKLNDLVTASPDTYVLTTKICNAICKLPVPYGNMLLGLINEYYVNNPKIKNPKEQDLVARINKKNNTLGLPFKGQTFENGKGPRFDADKMPQKLEKIIAAYVGYISKS